MSELRNDRLRILTAVEKIDRHIHPGLEGDLLLGAGGRVVSDVRAFRVRAIDNGVVVLGRADTARLLKLAEGYYRPLRSDRHVTTYTGGRSDLHGALLR